MSALPDGVLVRPLTPHRDDRGSFTELHRLEWDTGIEPVQWNAVSTNAGVLRGVHVHLLHGDYLIVFGGRATVGLADLRDGAPADRAAAAVECDGENPVGLTIPPGVAHGFYFHEPSLHVYSVSHYWDMHDELGCRWDDPDLGIPWPVTEARVSERDDELPSLAGLLDEMRGRRAA